MEEDWAPNHCRYPWEEECPPNRFGYLSGAPNRVGYSSEFLPNRFGYSSECLPNRFGYSSGAHIDTYYPPIQERVTQEGVAALRPLVAVGLGRIGKIMLQNCRKMERGLFPRRHSLLAKGIPSAYSGSRNHIDMCSFQFGKFGFHEFRLTEQSSAHPNF